MTRASVLECKNKKDNHSLTEGNFPNHQRKLKPELRNRARNKCRNLATIFSNRNPGRKTSWQRAENRVS
jgi:hypothetical protein